jgi:hypothetical protein
MYLTSFSIFIVLISLVFLVLFFQVVFLRKKIIQREQRIITLYKEKIDKIPAFIEIMSKNTAYRDIFLEITHLHKIAIISNIWNIYDLLENNSRIHHEFLFLMKVSVRLQSIHKNGHFLYIRDFIIFYENTITKELLFLDSDIERYNRLLQRKDLTIVGLFFPFKKRMKTSI